MKRGFHRSLAFSAAIIAIGCSPLAPSYHYRKAALGHVTLLLKDDSFALATQSASSLRIKIFRIVDQTPGPQVAEKVFAITAERLEATIPRVPLGWHEFRLALLNEAGESVGKASFRHLVRPGSQTIDDPVIIHLVPPDRRRMDVEILVYIQFTKPGDPPDVTYVNIKRQADGYCVRCHDANYRNSPNDPPGPAGKLFLDRYPFLSVKDNPPSFREIVEDSIKWMRDLSWPMPPLPADAVPESDITKWEKWIDNDLAQFPGGNGSTRPLMEKLELQWTSGDDGNRVVLSPDEDIDRFVGTARQLIIGQDYDIAMRLYAEDGTITQEEKVTLKILEDAAFEHLMSIVQSEGQIVIPIVISPEI